MKWAYGITTVPERRYNYLPSTIKSLKAAGFHKPTLFVDGPTGDYSEFNLSTVRRSEKILAFGNWLLSLMELWIRQPRADRFAIFQDDFITYKNLRSYLERFDLPDDRYWNLYTFPQNEDIREKNYIGWYPSNQRGRGAVALVFNNRTTFRLLINPILVAKPAATTNSHRSIDGVVLGSLFSIDVREYIHYPTLTQHTGDCSSIGNKQHAKPSSWLGEDFDATKLNEISKG